MKAFRIYSAVLLLFLFGVVAACPPGSKDGDCVEDCTRNCNGGMCVWRNGTEACICDESKSTGPNCEEAQPCADAKCSKFGRCTADNTTLLGYRCSCEDGFQGEICDEPIRDLCTGASGLRCENDAVCSDNKCVCKDGYGGELCANMVPLLSEYDASKCDPACAAVFADKKCNLECHSSKCFYDGLDCEEQVDEDSTIGAAACLKMYGNGVCDVMCNEPRYGFDGGDCDKDLKGGVVEKIQLTLQMKPTEVFLSHKFLLAYLAQITRSVVSISKNSEGQLEVYSIVNSTGVEERIALDDTMQDKYTQFTKMALNVDSTYCLNETWNCLMLNGTESTTIESMITLLDAAFVRRHEPLVFQQRTNTVSVYVQDVVKIEEPSAAILEIFLAVIISMVVTILLVVAVLVCYLARRRKRFEKKNSRDGGRPALFEHQKNRLVAAVEEGNVSCLTSLLAEMTPSEAANAEDVAGNTVLHMAAARDDKEVVRMLLQSRMFDVCSVNSIGQSPLLYALREGKPSLETLTMLVNAVNEEKMRQRTTNRNVRPGTSHLLMNALSEEPGWGLTDSVGRSALHYAALVGRAPLIHFFVSHGSSPGLQDASGNTPLHLAAINGHSETVRALLDERAAVTVTNSLGNTPAQVCDLNGHTNLAALLQEEENLVTSPIRPRHDSARGAMYSTVESVFSVEAEDLVLPSLLPSFSSVADYLNSNGVGGGMGCGQPSPRSLGGGGGVLPPSRLSLTGGLAALGGTPGGSGPPTASSTLSGSVDALMATTPKPTLPHILTPSSQLVEISPERHDGPPSTLPRKSLWGVERSPSDPRPSQLTSPYNTTGGYGKRRSLPDGPSISSYGPTSPVHFTYATNTMSSTSERSQSSAGHDSLVSSFRPLS